MSDDSYTIKEFIADKFDNPENGVFVRLDRIEAQTNKTNGRVTVLETRLSSYDSFKKTVSGLTGFKMWLTGAVAVILVLGSCIGYLFSNYVFANTLNIINEQKDSIIKSAVKETISTINQTYNLNIK